MMCDYDIVLMKSVYNKNIYIFTLALPFAFLWGFVFVLPDLMLLAFLIHLFPLAPILDISDSSIQPLLFPKERPINLWKSF